MVTGERFLNLIEQRHDEFKRFQNSEQLDATSYINQVKTQIAEKESSRSYLSELETLFQQQRAQVQPSTNYSRNASQAAYTYLLPIKMGESDIASSSSNYFSNSTTNPIRKESQLSTSSEELLQQEILLNDKIDRSFNKEFVQRSL